MKQIKIILCLLAVTFSITYAQAPTDSISIRKTFGGYNFYQGDQRLSMNQLVNALEPNTQAFNLIVRAQTTSSIATILEMAGGFMIGWPIGTAIGGGEPNWALAGVGAGLVVIAIPLRHNFIMQARQAVDIHNGGGGASSFWEKRELDLTLKGNGLGISLWF